MAASDLTRATKQTTIKSST